MVDGTDRQSSIQILLVDDDEAVRHVVVRQLTSLGYGVVACADGAEALKVLADRDDIDLLLVDMSMPGGLSGPEVARLATERRPTLKVLFASGQYDTEAGDEHFIVKPYRKHDLAQKIEDLLQPSTP